MNRCLSFALVSVFLCSGWAPAFGDRAEEILAATGVRGGLAVHVGCGSGELIASLAARGRFLVQGLDADADAVAKARALLRARGLGGRATAQTIRGNRLPYVSNLVNLLVIEPAYDAPLEEVMRVLAPRGVAYVNAGDGWRKAVKPVPAEMDDWGHFLHSPSGNAAGEDRLVGPPRHVQWVCGPRWGRSHENMSSVNAVVSAGGRLFAIVDEGPAATIYHSARWVLTARDAFNGVELWRKRIDRWQSSLYPLKQGPFQLPRRLVATEDKVYATLGIDQPVSELDAVTGEVIRTFPGTEATEEILHLPGKLVLLVSNDTAPLPYTSRGRVPPGLGLREFSVRIKGDRSVIALDLRTGRVVWRRPAGNVTPLTLAAAGGRVFYHAVDRVHCLELVTGEDVWQAELGAKTRYTSNLSPSLLVHDSVLVFGEPNRMSAVAAQDGRKLWSVEGMVSRCLAPISLFVINDTVWAPRSMAWNRNAGFAADGPTGAFLGYDLHTGRVKHQFPLDASLDIGVMHHRCHMPKASGKYLITGWPGIEFIDTTTGKMFTHSWVRGGCLVGSLPANGLIYAPPSPCACYPEAKLNGFLALAPARASPQETAPPESRLQRGPAYALAAERRPRPPAPGDWPTHRHDAMRTGSTATPISASLRQNWLTRLGGKLTQPVVADGKLFVSSVQDHVVHALDGATGRRLWRFQAGGRIDSPPTWHDGLLLFGCHDGWVYCLDADAGRLAWRFHAARNGRQIVSYGQLESLWPVPGSVLVQGNTAWFVAGRSSFVDGGLWLYRLNASTGELLSATRVHSLDAAGRQPRVRGPGLLRLEMPGALPDVLSTDGQLIYLRQSVFDLQGRPVNGLGRNHLFVANGFLDDSWFHRSFWTYGVGPINSRSGAGQGQGGGAKLMVMNAENIFYFGREAGIPRNHRYGEEYALACSPKASAPLSRETLSQKRKGKGQLPAKRTNTLWCEATSMHVRAMVLAGQMLFVAGPEGDWRGSPDVFEGRKGVALTALSAASGERVAETTLPASPIWDGVIAANGRLYASLEDGVVVCYGEAG